MKKILYLASVDWFWIKQRPQHFCELLSENNKVTYLCKQRWKKGKNVVISHSHNENQLNKYQIKINKNLNVIRKKLIPFQNKFKFISYLNDEIYRKYILDLDKKDNYDVIIITYPSLYNVIPKKLFHRKIFLYDCMDNYKSFNNVNKNSILNDEKKLINICNYIVVSSNDLYDNIIKVNSDIKDKTYIINNGVDIKSFNVNSIDKVSDDNLLKKNNNKKVGYVGTISEWVDLELIKSIALRNKNIEFYFIGPISESLNIDSFKSINNIKFVGSQPYYSIPNIVNSLDICIMPFKKSELVQSVNPVKIYEYLAMGKPVIALKYDETDKFGSLIYTYETEKQFEDCLYKILNRREEKDIINERINFAKKNSWKERVNKLEELISD